jgi:hypothetical protein
MKRIFTIALLVIILLSLIVLVSGCAEKGTVYETDLEIIANDKTYQLKSVVPCKGCAGIYILIPKDSTAKQPFSVQQKNGKVDVTVIKID